jgi:hypothetical protein
MKFRLLVTYRYRRNRTCRSALSTGTFTVHHSRIDRDDLRAMDKIRPSTSVTVFTPPEITWR